MDEYCEWEWISESVSLVDFNLKGIVYEFCRGGRRINYINNYNCNGIVLIVIHKKADP